MSGDPEQSLGMVGATAPGESPVAELGVSASAHWHTAAGASPVVLMAACGGGGGGAPAGNSPVASSPTTPQTPAWSPPADSPYARFLQQAQFSSPEADIAAVKSKGYAAWLDEQLALPSSKGGWDWLFERGYGVVDEREFYFAEWWMPDYMIWWQLFNSPDQVRRRMALALSEFFVVGVDGLNEPWFKPFMMARHWDLLCQGAFGNFRDLLEEVTLSLGMGSFLSTLNNQKEDARTGRLPDENYAREVMQLFTIGLVRLNLDGTPALDAQGKPQETYNQQDVSQLARVFTGWVADHSEGFTRSPVAPNFFNVANVGYTRRRMIQNPSRHSLLEKRFLGVTIPPGTDGVASLRIALDTLFQHPNVGPFFCRQMIQRLVTGNPSPSYVARVATVFNNNGAGVRGDLKAVWKAILTDEEARGSGGLTSATHGKLREPMVRMAQWGRTFKLRSKTGTWKSQMPNWGSQGLTQYPLRSASVFNFFRPGYVPPNTALSGTMATAPEFQIVNESSVSLYLNLLQAVVPQGLWVAAPDLPQPPKDSSITANGFDIAPDYSEEIALVSDPVALVRRLNLILAAGQLSQSTEEALVAILKLNPQSPGSSAEAKLWHVARAVVMVMGCTDYLVQK